METDFLTTTSRFLEGAHPHSSTLPEIRAVFKRREKIESGNGEAEIVAPIFTQF